LQCVKDHPGCHLIWLPVYHAPREDKCFIAKNLDNFQQYAEYKQGGFYHDEACMRADKARLHEIV